LDAPSVQTDRRIQTDQTARLDDRRDDQAHPTKDRMARQAVLGLTSLAHGRHLRQSHVLGRLGATLGRQDHLIITLLVPWRPPDPGWVRLGLAAAGLTFLTGEGL